MSAEIVVKRSVRKVITSDWSYSIAAGDDKASASGAYVDDFPGWAQRCPLIGSNHEDIPGMLLVSIDASRLEGDLIKVTLKYEAGVKGNYPGRSPETPIGIRRYSLQLSAGEEHILTHKRYRDLQLNEENEDEIEALMSIANGAKATDFKDKIKTTAGKECLKKIKKGILARKDARVIWVERFKSINLSDINFPIFNKRERPPKVGGVLKNWLYIGASAQELDEGGIFEIERSWEYSPDGWDEDLYS